MGKQVWHRVKRTKKEGGGIYPGLRYREHPERRHGIHKDRYYTLTYKVKGKTVSEACGWASEGWTPTKCYDLLRKLKENAKTGQGPYTLKDQRDRREKKEALEQAKLITLDEIWPKYLKFAQTKKKQSTWEKEEGHYRLWLSPCLGERPLRHIGMPEWDELVANLTSKKKAPRTVEYVTGTLRRILKYAYERQIVDEAPPSGKRIGVTGPGNSNRRLRVIRPDEAEAILDCLEKSDEAAWRMTKFAFLTGCRASEAYNLRWRDVDLLAERFTFTETKNKDARSLPISPSIRVLLGSEKEPEEYVFTKENGTPYYQAPVAFKRVVDKELKLNEGQTKRNRLTFHSIRHTVATNLARSLNLRDLMDVMGWRTVQMAMRYVKGSEDAQATALAGLEGGLSTDKGKVVPLRRANN
ncbi:site-specific integrase [Pseudodesulfovibrio sp. zrk46]|uniref:tyrosine-type recombinase/integrase n=1 Tax=Pseudodesulfovibrio sp. zrk46 TaxID=2725288 RepID=UPI0014495EAC|nr:site-specific integrase [Pseudodesulfovibrio sp. zrk46]QJB57384.1 site-specific integrase [Pseudodesulfovibrio sp. zrk46]